MCGVGPSGSRQCAYERGAIRTACQRSTLNSMTAATASIQMDLAFVGGEGEWTKDLNCVLLVKYRYRSLRSVGSLVTKSFTTARLFREQRGGGTAIAAQRPCNVCVRERDAAKLGHV